MSRGLLLQSWSMLQSASQPSTMTWSRRSRQVPPATPTSPLLQLLRASCTPSCGNSTSSSRYTGAGCFTLLSAPAPAATACAGHHQVPAAVRGSDQGGEGPGGEHDTAPKPAAGSRHVHHLLAAHHSTQRTPTCPGWQHAPTPTCRLPAYHTIALRMCTCHAMRTCAPPPCHAWQHTCMLQPQPRLQPQPQPDPHTHHPSGSHLHRLRSSGAQSPTSSCSPTLRARSSPCRTG